MARAMHKSNSYIGLSLIFFMPTTVKEALMNTRPPYTFPTSRLQLLIIAGLVLTAGCSDVVSLDATETEFVAEELNKRKAPPVNGSDIAAWGQSIQSRSTKARHFHLLDLALVPARPGKLIAGSDSVRLVVGTHGSATADSVLQIVLEKHKIFNRFEYKTAIHGLAVTMPVANLDSFITDTDNAPAVSFTEPDVSVPYDSGTRGTAPATTQEVPWSIPSIGADLSSTMAGDGTGEVDIDLYVLDSGAESSDLNIVECLQFTRLMGAEPCTSTEDQDGHGTGVALAAAAIDDQEGIVGVAPGARVHVVKALRENGNTPLGALVAVVDYLTERKLANPSVPMVVNISLGADVKTTRYNALDEAIQASIATGVVYVLSSGNSAINAEKVSPAHVAEAITVGAYNEYGLFSSFANYGSVLDISAPGEDVLSMTPQNELGYASGTSLAAPYVAGAAALLLSQEPTLTPAQVRERIVSSGTATIGGTPDETTNKALFVDW